MTVTGCTGSYVTVEWGDGGRTDFQNLAPGDPLYYTYSAYGVYYATMYVEFDPYECPDQPYAEYTFVFEYPSPGGST